MIAGGLLFAGGWAGRSLADEQRAPGRDVRSASSLPESGGPAGAAPSCTDTVAMSANANLADEVHEYQQRYLAEERARREAEAKIAEHAAALPARLTVAQAEWSREAREGVFRVRLPCGHWDATGRTETRTASGGVSVGAGHTFDARGRAALAGFTEQEIDAIPDAYARATHRVWQEIASTCLADQVFHEAAQSHGVDDDAWRVRVCSAYVVRMYRPSAQAAIARAAELRAAGTAPAESDDPIVRVLYGLGGASERLAEELARTFGREKAARLVDYGLACVDETLYVSAVSARP